MKKTKMMIKNKPKVSVLMPIYNTPLEHLRESVESILNQTYVDFEFVILNDSPDNIKIDHLILSYDDSRIKYLKNDINLGLEKSTNRLIDESVGKYIAIFDHDDISLPERLQKEVEYLDSYPKVGAVSAQFRLFGMQNFDTSNPLTSKDIRATLLTASCVSHTTLMMRRSVLQKNNIRYEKDFFPASSYRIITRLALVTDIVNLPDVLLKYRIDGNNTSLRNADKRAEARARISAEYGESLVKRALARRNITPDSVSLLGISPHFNSSRYYKVNAGSDLYFVKSEAKDLSNEYRMSKTIYDQSDKYFIEPISFYQDEYDYLVMRWSDGINLHDYMQHKKITSEIRKSFIDDLYGIFKHLRSTGIVHRDITPQNLLIINGRLKLVDFHFAVKYDNYQELDFVKNNISKVDMMGEPFAAGLLKWDDAFSLSEIAKYINNGNSSPVVEKISKKIDERAIIPSGEILREVILKQQRAIQERDAALARFNSIRKMLPYRLARKVYRTLKQVRNKL